MDDQNILDAPEDGDPQLKISIKVVFFAILGITGLYLLYFGIPFFGSLSTSNIELWIFKIDLAQLAFLAFTNLGLYFFMAFIKFEISHWYRVMTVSVTIILVATLISYFMLFGTTSSGLSKGLTMSGFIALVAGGGCSLAIQFLHKKHYFIFSSVMICTIVFFSLIEYL